MDQPLLQIDGLSLARGKRTVVHNVGLTVGRGERIALVGPNGAGKSSLIQAICGLLKPSAGRIRIEGADLSTLRPQARAAAMAYLPQDGTVAWNMPANEVVALGLPFLNADEVEARARAALDEVVAAALADRGIAELSGGERARVLLARVLASGAHILLADEPVAGLDPDGQLLALERLGARATAGQSVIASLHDLPLAARFADRVIVMHQGRVVADGSPRQALTADNLAEVFGVTGRWLEEESEPALALSRRQSTSDR